MGERGERRGGGGGKPNPKLVWGGGRKVTTPPTHQTSLVREGGGETTLLPNPVPPTPSQREKLFYHSLKVRCNRIEFVTSRFLLISVGDPRTDLDIVSISQCTMRLLSANSAQHQVQMSDVFFSTGRDPNRSCPQGQMSSTGWIHLQ